MSYGNNNYQGNTTGWAPQQNMMQPMQNGYQQPQPMQSGYQQMQNSYAQVPPRSNPPRFGDWVDGEDAARAYQFPPNWPIDTPMTLWDINDDVFYVRAKDEFGRPTPLKKARFVWEQTRGGSSGQSGNFLPSENYATKDDLQNMKNEIMASLRSPAPNRTQQPANQNGGARE